jgi:protocatechuate 3,4-dioxygenase beta subunit
MPHIDTRDRRLFLQSLSALGMAAFTVPGLFAQQLTRTTATTTEGPFYPDKLPLDTDNDLLIINDGITPGVGEITHLTGRVTTASGQPIRNAIVEIWQVDQGGSYIHTGGRQPSNVDKNFQGYGRFLTDAKGQYYFRTIKPVEYTLIGIHRCPHIHMAVSKSGQRVFTSQLMVKGHPANDKDSVFNGVDRAARETVLADFRPLDGSRIGELTASWDIVLGRTAEEFQDGPIKGFGASERRRG